MSRFEVSPAELEGAARTLGSVEGSLGRPSSAAGELGSAELETAVAGLFQAADQVALAMGHAVAQASQNASAAAGAYTRTDAQAMPSGGP